MNEYIVGIAQEYTPAVLGTTGVKEKIVRCRNCKHYRNYGMLGCWCLRSNDNDSAVPITYNGFCAWGERRDDD